MKKATGEHISELNEAKTVMRELEAIIASSYDGLFITDGNGVVLRMNAAYERLTGIKADEVVGKNMKDLIDVGYYDQSVTLLVMEKKERITITQNIRGSHEYLVTGNPIFDGKGQLFRVVTNVRDITELARLQEQIKKTKERTLQYQTELSHLRSMQMDTKDIIFRSQSMEKVLATARKVANVDSTVLITGESGTGKELIAKLIHGAGKGVKQPFIKINCAALPEQLLESELFGYEKGAFTGAGKEGKPGLFELAHNGTLFLDEIGDMTPALQVKILRALQEREIMRVGGTKPVSVKVRIIAATHRDLTKMVDAGAFRDDLYYRLMVVPIHLPPLRSRREDIPMLIWHFLDKYNKKFSYNKLFSAAAIDKLTEYEWKGNVREMENIIERMVVTSSDDELSVEHLPEYIRKKTYSPTKNMKMKEMLAQAEANLLADAYQEYLSWDRVAVELGIDRATAYRKARKYGLCKK
ncbi:MAG: norR 9 [Firmicutes bacterium]|nr:norR 9 [Bacillota bacterium]